MNKGNIKSTTFGIKFPNKMLRWILVILGLFLLTIHISIMCKMIINGRRTYEKKLTNNATPSKGRNSYVYIVLERKYSKTGIQIINILETRKIRYKIVIHSNGTVTIPKFAKYKLLIFENVYTYFNLKNVTKQIIEKYCQNHKVGIIGFIDYIENNSNIFNLFPVNSFENLSLKDYEVSMKSDIPYLIKTGKIHTGVIPFKKRVGFVPINTTYSSIVKAKDKQSNISFSTVMHDNGKVDNIQKVIFANDLKYWVHMLLFLDTISYLTHGELENRLSRYVQIDIDDIFVAKTGTRMLVKDVEALIASQKKLSESIPGFKFNLGFSGKYFQSGTIEENQADSLLIEYRHNFSWFDHTYSHKQPHLCDYTCIEQEMLHNKQFALEHGIKVDSDYSVTPHHSGVYPVHFPLFKAWKNVWNLKVTSTEEYPHLTPPSRRKGFVHEGIMVLPRQTCGLYTHTMFKEKYPGGINILDKSVEGGTLFETVILNQISIFMTHMTNYANDQLAIYAFEKLMTFIRKWTNIRLIYTRPIALAKIYFEMFPEEIKPLWENPCKDKRHLKIWNETNNCEKLPEFIIIGPQKSGTTALYDFLSFHPSLAPSIRNNRTFEEVQFFNSKNYEMGLKWYTNQFNLIKGKVLFEKSANYFDANEAPKRIHALLPNVKLIAILINPSERAYSWYQHCRAKGEKVAVEHTFYEIVTATSRSSSPLKELQERCLKPGLYAKHLKLWLSYYSLSSLLIVDGELLEKNPVKVMDKVQEFLKLNSYMNYSNYLKYNKAKGYFCHVISKKRMKCLGKGKGRVYPDMSANEKNFLSSYFRKPNGLLFSLLQNLSLPIPKWLRKMY